MSALPKPTALMSMGALRLVEAGERPEPRRLASTQQDAQLLGELRSVRQENTILTAKLEDSESKLRELRKKLRSLQKLSTRQGGAAGIEFASAEEWVRHHVHLSWLENYSAIDRAEYPLAGYLVGEAFASSVQALAPHLQSKVWRCVVDVVTRRGRYLHSRGAHPLRSGNGAHSHDVVRSGDDARCFRYYVGFKAAGARRLHAWHLQDGSVELSRVVTHDDMAP